MCIYRGRSQQVESITERKERKERKEREKGKGEKRRKVKKERKSEGEEMEREKGRKGSQRSDGRNSLDQGVKSGDSMRVYVSRGRYSSYFGLLLAFGLLFLG